MTDDKELRSRIRDICEVDDRYSPEAYFFVQAAVGFTLQILEQQPEDKPRHISGPELLNGIRAMALEQFGPLARTVFTDWGVTCCRDFGCIVFNMVDHSLLSARKNDSIADFEDGYDFAEAFDQPFRPAGRVVQVPVIDVT